MKKFQPPSREGVSQMFSEISSTYDKVNRFMTFGLDQQWRKTLALDLPKKKHLKVLDLATGTGDQILSLLEKNPHIRKIVGVDLSLEMLELARLKIKKKPYAHKVSFKQASALELPFKSASFDVVTISFGIRNFTNVEKALQEIKRVLNPRGKLLILEGSLPKNRLLKKGHLLFLRYFLPWIGGILSKNKGAYEYLDQTIETFPTGDAFLSLLQTAGFLHLKAKPLLGGVVSIYSGENHASM